MSDGILRRLAARVKAVSPEQVEKIAPALPWWRTGGTRINKAAPAAPERVPTSPVQATERAKRIRQTFPGRKFRPAASAYGRGRVLGSMKRGGKVKKTGSYKLHKGERVVPLSSLKGC